MKGVVFGVLERVFSEEFGEDAWDDLLDAAGSDGVFASLGSYEDQEFFRLVKAAAVAMARPEDAVLLWFGTCAIPVFREKYAPLFTRFDSFRPFLLALNDIIHPEVRKIYPGADVPDFGFDNSHDDVLVLTYRSKRRMCAFAEGLVKGSAESFGESVDVEHSACVKLGDPTCELRVLFKGAAR